MPNNDLASGTTVYSDPPAPNVMRVDVMPGGVPSPTDVIDAAIGLTKVNVIRYPLDTPKYYLSMEISKYLPRRDPFNIQTDSLFTKLIMPLPMQIVDSQHVNYDVRAIGSIPGAAVNGVYAGDVATGGKGMAAQMGQAMDAAQSLNDFAGAPGQAAVQGALDVASMGLKQFAALNGVAPNNFEVVLLKGPSFKRHTYTWSASPQSPAEAEALRKMLVLLKNSMAPGIRLGGSIYTFPRVFQLSFVPNPKYLYKHKPAVLEKLTVDYSAAEIPSFFQKRPETFNIESPTNVSIQMTFLELEFWLNGDFGDDNFGSGHTERSLITAAPTPKAPEDQTGGVPIL